MINFPTLLLGCKLEWLPKRSYSQSEALVPGGQVYRPRSPVQFPSQNRIMRIMGRRGIHDTPSRKNAKKEAQRQSNTKEFALAAKKVDGTPWKCRKTWGQTCRWRGFCLTGKVSPKILHGYENMVRIIVFNMTTMRSKIWVEFING